jgi:hypothetical protein
VAKAIAEFDAVIIGPGSFYTSLMPIFLVGGVPEALAQVKGPVILVANLLTEGRGMIGFTAADAVARIEQAIQRKVDVVIINTKWPPHDVLARYALEHKEQSLPSALLYAQGLELKRFRRGIPILDTVITLAPLLGLLGTVAGILQTFSAISGPVEPARVIALYAPAITATGSGLFMALLNILPTWIVMFGRDVLLSLGGGEAPAGDLPS